MFWSLLVAAALAAPVTLTTSDGQAIHADVNGKGERALLLVHADQRSHTDWQFFTKILNDLGYRTMAIDLRGHGQSTLGQEITETDYLAMPLDAQAGVQWLAKNGAKHITAVGDQLGGSVLLAAVAETPAINSLLLLTPHLSNNGLKVSTALLEKLGDRPIMMAAGIDDAKSVKAATLMESKLGANARVEIVTDGGEGISMLNRAPHFESLVVSWISQSGELQKAGKLQGEDRLKASDVDKIETTGTRFTDR